jgi:hypothetical protein
MLSTPCVTIDVVMIGRICSAIGSLQNSHMTQVQTKRIPDKDCGRNGLRR